MFCKKCGKKISDDAIFCSFCGTKQDLHTNDLVVPEVEEKPHAKIHAENTQTSIDTPMSTGSIDTNQNAVAKKRKLPKILISAACIVVAIIIVIVLFVKYNNDKQNAYSIGVSSSDYTYIFDDSDGTNVISTITSKYDLKEFSIKISYDAEKGLLNYYEEIYDIGEIKAGEQIKITKPISEIEKEIKGSFYYASASVVSGKKQYKYYTNPQDKVYNEECSFTFNIYYRSDSPYFNIAITNNTSYYISELRTFRVTIDYDGNKKCSFYTPRIKLQTNLAPGDTVTVKNLTGNTTHNGMDSALSPYTSSSYSATTYQVIYA